LYTLLWIAFVYLRRDVVLPLDIALLIDALFVVLLIAGGSAFLASDYLQHCDLLEASVRCGVMKTATAFVLVAFLFFLSSVGWGAYVKLERKKNTQTKTSFHAQRNSVIDVLDGEAGDMDDPTNVVDYIAPDAGQR
jgi:hypothetical protein